ncbi:hypothetical protein MLJ63_14380 [Saccharolobus shibatae]|uniref:hypothetical protein n=1 Tax=Saccharolobus shibatae TaxID=2286 RepID=UPI001F0FD8C4|nr:hypothetical protein [Saccharolobus shibatae]MCH4816865.1 hypothetical protein [Saccharolobus shibatae]
MSFIVYPGVNVNYYLSKIIDAFNLNALALGAYGANPFLFWYYGLVYVFSLIPLIYSEEIMIFLLLSFGSMYVYRLVYEIVLDNLKSKTTINAIIAGLISATFFVSNWGLAEAYAYNIILTVAFIYPLFPIMTYYIRALFIKSPGILYIIRNLVIISILGTIIISTANIFYFLQTVGYIVFIFLFYSISRNLRKFIKNLFLSISSFILLALGNYYWISLSAKPAQTVVSDKGFISLSLYYFKTNSLYMPFWLVIRDLGFNGPFKFPEYSLILSFIIPILTFIPLLIIKNVKEVTIYIVMTFIAITFWAGITTPFSSLYLYLIGHLPYFIEFRTENVAFAWLASFLFSITVGLGYAALTSRFRLKRYIIVVGLVILIVLSVIVPYPVFNGSLSARISIPNYFIASVNFINSQNEYGEVLILPKSPNWFFSTWYVGTNIWQYFSNKPVIYGGVYSSSELSIRMLYDNITSLISLNNYTYINILELKNIFILLNIKYIVVENDSTTTPYTVVDKYVQNLFYLQKYGIVSFLHKFDKIYIFKTNVNSSYFYLFSPKYLNYISNITPKDIENIDYSKILVPINNYTLYHNGKFILNSYQKNGYLFVIFNYNPSWNINGIHPNESYIYNYEFGNIFPINLSSTIIILKNNLQDSTDVSLIEIFSYLIFMLLVFFLINIYIILRLKSNRVRK